MLVRRASATTTTTTTRACLLILLFEQSPAHTRTQTADVTDKQITESLSLTFEFAIQKYRLVSNFHYKIDNDTAVAHHRAQRNQYRHEALRADPGGLPFLPSQTDITADPKIKAIQLICPP